MLTAFARCERGTVFPSERTSKMTDTRYVQRSERTSRGNERHAMALAYVWGREDAGDRRLRDTEQGSDRYNPSDFSFANFAANEADAYQREQRTSLENIRDQYERFLATRTVDSHA